MGEAAKFGAKHEHYYTRQMWRHWAIQGEMKAWRIGRDVVVHRDDLVAFIRARWPEQEGSAPCEPSAVEGIASGGRAA